MDEFIPGLAPTVRLASDATGNRLVDTAAHGRRFVELSAAETKLIKLWDGEMTAAQLCDRARARGLMLEPRQVAVFLERLAAAGMLARPPVAGTTVLAADVEGPVLVSDVVPALRSDLVLARAKHGSVHVTDPLKSRTFTLYEFEASIARLLDGRRTAGALVEAAAVVGVSLSIESLRHFIKQLRAYRFIADADAHAAATTWAPRQAWGPELREMFRSALRLSREGRGDEALEYLDSLLQVDSSIAEARELKDRILADWSVAGVDFERLHGVAAASPAVAAASEPRPSSPVPLPGSVVVPKAPPSQALPPPRASAPSFGTVPEPRSSAPRPLPSAPTSLPRGTSPGTSLDALSSVPRPPPSAPVPRIPTGTSPGTSAAELPRIPTGTSPGVPRAPSAHGASAAELPRTPTGTSPGVPRPPPSAPTSLPRSPATSAPELPRIPTGTSPGIPRPVPSAPTSLPRGTSPELPRIPTGTSPGISRPPPTSSLESSSSDAHPSGGLPFGLDLPGAPRDEAPKPSAPGLTAISPGLPFGLSLQPAGRVTPGRGLPSAPSEPQPPAPRATPGKGLPAAAAQASAPPPRRATPGKGLPAVGEVPAPRATPGQVIPPAAAPAPDAVPAPAWLTEGAPSLTPSMLFTESVVERSTAFPADAPGGVFSEPLAAPMESLPSEPLGRLPMEAPPRVVPAGHEPELPRPPAPSSPSDPFAKIPVADDLAAPTVVSLKPFATVSAPESSPSDPFAKVPVAAEPPSPSAFAKVPVLDSTPSDPFARVPVSEPPVSEPPPEFSASDPFAKVPVSEPSLPPEPAAKVASTATAADPFAELPTTDIIPDVAKHPSMFPEPSVVVDENLRTEVPESLLRAPPVARKPAPAPTDAEDAALAASLRGGSKRGRIIAAVVVVVLAVVAGVLFRPVPRVVEVECEVKPLDARALTAPRDGVLVAWTVRPGARFTERQALAQLETKELDAQAAELKGKVDAVATRLDGKWPKVDAKKAAKANAAVTKAQRALDAAVAKKKKAGELPQAKRAAALKKAEKAEAAAAAALAKARAALEALTHEAERARLAQEKKSLEDELAARRSAIDASTLLAPSGGFLADEAKPGDRVTAGQALGVVLTGRFEVKAKGALPDGITDATLLVESRAYDARVSGEVFEVEAGKALPSTGKLRVVAGTQPAFKLLLE